MSQWTRGSKVRTAADMLRQSIGLARGVVIEQAVDGYRYFGRIPEPGNNATDMAKASTERFLEALTRKGFASPNLSPMYPNPPGAAAPRAALAGVRERIWWRTGSYASGAWAAKLGMDLQQSATVADDGSGAALHVQPSSRRFHLV